MSSNPKKANKINALAAYACRNTAHIHAQNHYGFARVSQPTAHGKSSASICRFVLL